MAVAGGREDRVLQGPRRAARRADDNPFFAGEGAPCINGQVAASGASFGQDVQSIMDRVDVLRPEGDR